MTSTTLPLVTRMLAVEALFEGSRAGTINVWDEAYLSVGTIHYALRGGSGFRFLSRIQALDPDSYAKILGAPFADATSRGSAALIQHCRVSVWKRPNTWQPAFRRLAMLPAYAQADRECAQPYLESAVKLAHRYGLTSERGLTFCLDRAVQQGGTPRRPVDRAFAKLTPGLPEYNVMKALARAYAASANPKYAGIVLARSLTVAMGNTQVSGYPGSFTLIDAFGIRPDKAWVGQI